MNDTQQFWKTPNIGERVHLMPPALEGTDTPLQRDYRRRCDTPSDINEHMPVLRALAAQCHVICEFGVRTGNSTIALLAGLEAGGMTAAAYCDLWSWDIQQPQMERPVLPPWLRWNFEIGDTARLGRIPRCDLLFIDTAHTGVHVTAELQYHASVARFIVFHDTVLYGEVGMDGKPGVLVAAREFQARHHEWVEFAHHLNNNGLLVLERRSSS